MLIKEEVYNYQNKPLIVGKSDEHNDSLIPGYGELTADDLSKIILIVMLRDLELNQITIRLILFLRLIIEFMESL